MARKGRFGRLPRRAADLTGAVVAMMREYWNIQENIMVSSWREGGEVDGKQVTDERLLEFWKERRDTVQEDDPLWDYYDQQHDQYKFAIEESKVGLAYSQHKMSARQVANWYKGQASNYVKNSEMYRTVMGQAAKFLDAAKAQSKAATQAARVKAYTRQRDSIDREFMWPAQIINTGLLLAFRRLPGGLYGSQTATEINAETPVGGTGEGQQLYDIGIGQGAEVFDDVLIGINTPGSAIYDWWQTNIIGPAKRDGLDISGPFDQSDLQTVLQRSMEGIDKKIALNQRFDDVAPKGENEKLRAVKTQTIDFGQFVGTWDELSIYAQRRRALEDTIVYDRTASPLEQMKAYSDYAKGLSDLSKQVGDQNPVFTTALSAELNALLGRPSNTPTILEGALNTPFGATPAAGSENQQVAMYTNQLRADIRSVAAGEAVFSQNPDGTWGTKTYSELQSDGMFIVMPGKGSTVMLEPATPAGGGYGEGEYSKGADPFAPTEIKKTPLTISYGTAYRAMPIVARSASFTRDPYTGRELGEGPAPAGDNNLGYVAYIPKGEGGEEQAIYGIYGLNGQLGWTIDNPFLPGSQTSMATVSNTNGTQLVVTADPKAPGATLFYDEKGQPIDTSRGITQGTDAEGKQTINGVVVGDVRYNQRYGLGNISTGSTNPYALIDPTIRLPNSPRMFATAGMAPYAMTDSGRKEMASWTIEETYNAFRGDPFMNWADQNQTTRFWREVSAVRIAATVDTSDPNAVLNSEWRFYQQVRQERGQEVGGTWDQAINQMQRAALVGSEVRERISVGTPAPLANRLRVTLIPGQYEEQYMPDGSTIYVSNGKGYNRNQVNFGQAPPATPIPRTPSGGGRYTREEEGGAYVPDYAANAAAAPHLVPKVPGSQPTIKTPNIKTPALMPGRGPNTQINPSQQVAPRPVAPTPTPTPTFTPSYLPPLPPPPRPVQIPGVGPLEGPG